MRLQFTTSNYSRDISLRRLDLWCHIFSKPVNLCHFLLLQLSNPFNYQSIGALHKLSVAMATCRFQTIKFSSLSQGNVLNLITFMQQFSFPSELKILLNNAIILTVLQIRSGKRDNFPYYSFKRYGVIHH